MKPINKSFSQWKESELYKYLGLTPKEDGEYLNQWLNKAITLSPNELSLLEELRQEARMGIKHWNEMELRQHFITPLVRLVKFQNYRKNIKAFAERTLTKTIQNALTDIVLYGTVDWLVATGLESPEHPFFFIHEYKKEKGTDNDPLAQLVTAMVVAQELNKIPPEPTLFNQNPEHFYKDIPIYGSYVMGRYWFFVVLKDKEYSLSKPYISTELEDLQAIFKTLKAQKQMIYSYLAEK